MEIKMLEQGKKRIKFQIIGEDHTLCNALRKELWNDKDIEIAGYSIEHPLVSQPIMTVETNGKETPKKALLKAISNLKAKNKDLISKSKNLK
jgi:DNA-directed RNA polymerase subunit L